MNFDYNILYIGILLLVFIYLVYSYINSKKQPIQDNAFINMSITTVPQKKKEKQKENYVDYQKLNNDESIIYNGEIYNKAKAEDGTYELDQSY